MSTAVIAARWEVRADTPASRLTYLIPGDNVLTTPQPGSARRSGAYSPRVRLCTEGIDLFG